MRIATRMSCAVKLVPLSFAPALKSVRRPIQAGGSFVLGLALLAAAPVLGQQGTFVIDANGPRLIVPSTRTTQVMVLNGDASLMGFSTLNPPSYALNCASPGGVATSGGASQTLALDETNNAAFQTGAGMATPVAIGQGVPYSGNNCSYSPALAAGGTGAKAVQSVSDVLHRRLFVISAGKAGSADTITAYDTNSVGYYQPSAQALMSPLQANLDTGGTYTSAVADSDGLYGDAVVTELRTATSAGGMWVFSNAFGRATKVLGPGGVDLPAVNSFIIHNPSDGGGGLLVLVNQDGLTASNLGNPPLDTTPFTIIDLGQLHDLLGAKNFPRTLTLPTLTTIPSSLNYYAMLGAVYNPVDRSIYAVVGGGTSLTNIQRQIVRYDLSLLDAPTETVMKDVSSVPLSSSQATQLALNAASGTLQILAKDAGRLFTAGLATGGPAVSEMMGSTFNDSNFAPSFIASNSLLGETYIASTAQVDVLTRPAGTKKLAILDLTGPEVQATVGVGSVQLLGLFPDISDTALSTTNITITAIPVIGGAPFTFATVNAGQTLTLPTYVSGTFPVANIYNLVASFPGDAQYAPVTSAPVTIAVGQAYFNTTTTATANFNIATGAGSATVTLLGSTYVPSGTITVKSVNSGVTLATFFLSGGISNPMIIPFTAPSSTTDVVVAYSGDSKNQASTTGNVVLTQVAVVTPTLTATLPSAGAVGSSTHLNVVFSSTTTKVPTGNITIFASSATSSYVAIGTLSAAAAFASGGAGLNWTPSLPGTYSVYAQYAGDANYYPLTTQVGTIVISSGAYAFTMSAPTTAVAGTTFNVVVNASSGSGATGNVTVQAFKLGTTTPVNLGTVSAAATTTGGATLAATIPTSGVYILNGSYAGDANNPAVNSANSPTVNVTGGTTAAVTLTPASVSLTVSAGSSFQRSFLLYNTGGAGLTISSIATTGQGFSQFNGCPTTLQAGANCTINVVFAPTVVGIVTGTLSIADNATGSPHTAALTGTGTPGTASVSPATVTFIDQTVGTGSFLRPRVTLTNTSTSAFTINSVVLSSTPDFEITTSPCGSQASLAPGNSCTVSLEFHPTTVGAKTATLTFNTLNSTVSQTVTLTGNGLSGNPATPPTCVDTDGDGLCDDWETNGVWVRTSATAEKFIDLPAMGADPMHRDIFVQADFMETAYVPTGDHSHQMTANAAYEELLGFDQSPVMNPDLTTGIHLHVDCGPTCIMILKNKQTWGALSQAGGMIEQPLLDIIHNGTGQVFDWTKYDQASSVFLASGRNLIFHHAIMAHMQNAGNTSSGLSRNGTNFNLGASDLIVSFGGWPSVVGTDAEQAGTLMHELGHNLGLHHGGDLDDNYKPNYLSIMNYYFQTGGVIFDNGKGPGNGFFDYSRFLLPALDETQLDEVNGLNANPATFTGAKNLSISKYGTMRYCKNDDPLKVSPQVANYVDGNVNWNCNQIRTVLGATVTLKPYIDPRTVNEDINADGVLNLNYNGTVYPLTSFNDWPALVYTGGSIAGNGLGQAPPITTQAVEITHDQDSLIPKLYMVAIRTMGRVRSAPNSKITLNVVIANTGTTDDTYTLGASTLGGWAINASLPGSVAVPAKGTATVSVTYTVPSNANNGDKDTLLLTAQSQNDDFISDTKEVGIYAITTPFPDSLSTAQVVFGSQALGSTSATETVTILNTGSANLNFGTITTTAEFTETDTCSTSLAIGASCVVSVTFTPVATGARTGTLLINDGTGTAKTLALTGTAVPAAVPIPAVTLTINPVATFTGQTVTFNVNVSGATTAVPTGTVTISSGTTRIGQVTLDTAGNGTFTSSTLTAGTYSLLATYSGDATFRTTTSPNISLSVVTATPTTIALTTSAASISNGSTVTFTATLGGGSGTSQPSGLVRFLDGTTQIGTGSLNASGVATFAISTLAAGAHSITASYTGDNVFGGSVSTVLTETVGIFATTNLLTASATTVVTGTPVTLTATLTATTGTPTGTITFLDGTTTLGTGALNASGVNTLTTAALALGTHSITAVYAATGNFGSSTSTAVQVVVTGIPDFSASASPASLSLASGTSGTAVFTVSPVNGYSGTLSVSCGTLPTYANCTFAPDKLTLAASAQAPQTTMLTFATGQATASLRPGPQGRNGSSPIAFAIGFPFGLLAMALGWKGHKVRSVSRLYGALAFAVLASIIGMAGCGSRSAPHTTAAGTYVVPITITDGTTSHTVSFSVTVK